MSEKKTRNFFDKELSKFASRKLIVWIVATGLLFAGKLTSSDWVLITGLYLGGQSIVDLGKLKGLDKKAITSTVEKVVAKVTGKPTPKDETGHAPKPPDDTKTK